MKQSDSELSLASSNESSINELSCCSSIRNFRFTSDGYIDDTYDIENNKYFNWELDIITPLKPTTFTKICLVLYYILSLSRCILSYILNDYTIISYTLVFLSTISTIIDMYGFFLCLKEFKKSKRYIASRNLIKIFAKNNFKVSTTTTILFHVINQVIRTVIIGLVSYIIRDKCTLLPSIVLNNCSKQNPVSYQNSFLLDFFIIICITFHVLFKLIQFLIGYVNIHQSNSLIQVWKDDKVSYKIKKGVIVMKRRNAVGGIVPYNPPS